MSIFATVCTLRSFPWRGKTAKIARRAKSLPFVLC
jgi:hypothetical protein